MCEVTNPSRMDFLTTDIVADNPSLMSSVQRLSVAHGDGIAEDVMTELNRRKYGKKEFSMVWRAGKDFGNGADGGWQEEFQQVLARDELEWKISKERERQVTERNKVSSHRNECRKKMRERRRKSFKEAVDRCEPHALSRLSRRTRNSNITSNITSPYESTNDDPFDMSREPLSDLTPHIITSPGSDILMKSDGRLNELNSSSDDDSIKLTNCIPPIVSDDHFLSRPPYCKISKLFDWVSERKQSRVKTPSSRRWRTSPCFESFDNLTTKRWKLDQKTKVFSVSEGFVQTVRRNPNRNSSGKKIPMKTDVILPRPLSDRDILINESSVEPPHVIARRRIFDSAAARGRYGAPSWWNNSNFHNLSLDDKIKAWSIRKSAEGPSFNYYKSIAGKSPTASYYLTNMMVEQPHEVMESLSNFDEKLKRIYTPRPPNTAR